MRLFKIMVFEIYGLVSGETNNPCMFDHSFRFDQTGTNSTSRLINIMFTFIILNDLSNRLMFMSPND